MSTTPPPQPPPLHFNLWTILSESNRIIKAHSRHFLGLSVLFLLPLSFSVSAYPVINQLFSQSSIPKIETYLSFSLQQQPPPTSPVIFALFTLFNFVFSLLAAGSVVYSVFHGFYGRPVKLLSAINSAFTSFFPLTSTSLVSVFIIYGFLLFLLLIPLLIVLGLQVNYSSPYFLSLCLVSAIIFIFIALYLQVNWTFVYVVVVVESSWGLGPLKRSTNLVKGTKKVAFSIILFFGLLTWFYMWVSSAGWDDDKWRSWGFVLNIVGTSTILMILMLYNLAATTVFYIYAKAVHGELAGEIVEEFARDYVSLPFDDGKVPHVVSVV